METMVKVKKDSEATINSMEEYDSVNYRNNSQTYSSHSTIIADHLNTLIGIDCKVGTPSSRSEKAFTDLKGIANQKIISHRWRTKVQVHNSKNSSRRNSINLLQENIRSISSVESSLKDTQPNVIGEAYDDIKTNPPPHLLFDEKKTIPTSRDRGSFSDFCEQSTIHGLKYIGDPSLSKLKRTFWTISWLFALCGAGWFIHHLYFKFTTSPIIISRSPTSVPIDQIPFPALTICNMNNVKKSFAQQIIQEKDEVQNFLLNDVCNETITAKYDEPELVKNNKQVEKILINEFLLKASQSCPEMLHYCRWNSNDANCLDIFNPVYTDEGICCNFNSVKRIFWQARTWHGLNITYASGDHVDWDPEYVFQKSDPPTAIPWRGHGSGASRGLTVALDVNLDEYYCSSTASVGFKMLLHSPVETPQMREYGFTLSPGKETRIIITPHITDAAKSIQSISVDIRQCYFLNERRLRFYKTYTQRNCQLECEANSTLKWCNCMQYYMPVEEDTEVCDQTNDECIYKVKRMMHDSFEYDENYQNDSTIAHGCKCYPGCYEIDYSTEISQSTLVATFEIGHKYLKKNPVYFENNIAIVHVFYVDSSYTKYTKNELYGFAELLSNTGGLLGLFMGFSLLSVTEIAYYILLWILKLVQGRKKKNDLQLFVKKRDAVYPFAQ